MIKPRLNGYTSKVLKSQSAAVGVWSCTVPEGYLEWDHQMYAMYGVDDNDPRDNIELWMTHLHPDDSARAVKAYTHAVETYSQFDCNFRIITAAGDVRFIHAFALPETDEAGNVTLFAGINIDETDLHEERRERRKAAKILEAVTRLQSNYIIGGNNREQVFAEMHEHLLQMTESEYGFLGEILWDQEKQQRYLKTYSITDISWNAESERFYAENAPEGLVFNNLDTLFGEVIKTGETLIANDAGSHKAAAGIPEGHPALKRFLGIPLYAGTDFVGMIGLANRSQPYDRELIDDLKPFLLSAAHILKAERVEEERKSGIHDLRKAIEQAELANTAKSNFLANISHEVRTPLNCIIGFTELMQERISDGRDAEYLALMKQAGNSLLAIVEDMLDLTQIDAGGLRVDRQTTDLEALRVDLLSDWSEIFACKGLGLEVHINELACQSTIRVDQKHLKRVLHNLISNAHKFTNSGGATVHIDLITEGDNNRLECRVSDTGIGISEDIRDRIFGRFEQADGAFTRQHGGTGLGLAISHELAQLMKGTIELVSASDEGSEFLLTIPCSRIEQKHVPNLDDLPLEEIEATVPYDCTKPATPKSQASLDASKAHVLVVEDNFINRKLIEQMLHGKNCELTCVENGQLAVEAASAGNFDLILMDIQMPIKDGVTATKEIRKLREPMADVPIIATTANTLDGAREEYLNAGMNAYVQKPINRGVLIAEMEKCLGRSITLDE